MSGPVWRIEDPEPHPTPPGVVQGSWVSLHYLRSALRRRWRFVAGMASAGLLLALMALFVLPHSATASATVLLAHDPSADPLIAIQNDEGLLTARTVSADVVDSLHLPMSADDFQRTFTTNQVSTQVLRIDLKAPTAQEAVRRLNALADEFLNFRNTALSYRANEVVAANTANINTLQGQLGDLTKKYNAALAAGQGQLAQGYLTQKSSIEAQVGSLQQESQTTALQADSLAKASRVIDTAAPLPPGGKKHIVLGVMSGLILGGGLGVGVVFAHALISNSLRRREEVATAIGRPVTFSAGPIRGRLPWGEAKRRRNLEVLVTGLVSALPEDRSRGEHLGLLGVGDLRSAAVLLVATGRALQDSGDRVFLVDLTEEGWLARTPHGDLAVYAPEERPHLSDGPLSLVASADSRLPEGDPHRKEWDDASVVLVLGEVELGVGTGHLSTWTDRVVLLVGSGTATAELLRSISRMLTRSGPELVFAMLVGADRTDESLGVPRRVDADEQRRRAR